jgi:hypothetical protein
MKNFVFITGSLLFFLCTVLSEQHAVQCFPVWCVGLILLLNETVSSILLGAKTNLISQ